MQHVLVHIDQNIGPVGAWSYLNGRLTHFYPGGLDQSIAARAREAMAQRTDEFAIPAWFDLLADADPTMLDEYRTCRVKDGVSLPAVVAEFRRAWRQPD